MGGCPHTQVEAVIYAEHNPWNLEYTRYTVEFSRSDVPNFYDFMIDWVNDPTDIECYFTPNLCYSRWADLKRQGGPDSIWGVTKANEVLPLGDRNVT